MGERGAQRNGSRRFSITGFNSRKVYEAAFGMDARERLTKKVLLEVVRRYDGSMAEVPYF